MKLRWWILVTHRWLGLVSSGVLAVLGITGALLIWPRPQMLVGVLGPLHERLALGRFGWWVVVITTVVAVLIQVGGVYLWWRRKRLAMRLDRGFIRGIDDVHHAVGALAAPLMLVIAVTGVGMAFVGVDQPTLRRVLVDLHTTRGYATWLKALYTVASLGFAVQGLTGVLMWAARTRRLVVRGREAGAE